MEAVNNEVIADAIRRLKARIEMPDPAVRAESKRVRLPPREAALVDMLYYMVKHVSVLNGSLEVSDQLCRGCSHDRTSPCPVPQIRALLKEIGIDAER